MLFIVGGVAVFMMWGTDVLGFDNLRKSATEFERVHISSENRWRLKKYLKKCIVAMSVSKTNLFHKYFKKLQTNFFKQ